MLRIAYKLRISEKIRAQCSRHKKYDPSVNGRAGVEENCSTCKEILALYTAKVELDDSAHAFQRRAAAWQFRALKKHKP
jgi:hypothetical protein